MFVLCCIVCIAVYVRIVFLYTEPIFINAFQNGEIAKKKSSATSSGKTAGDGSSNDHTNRIDRVSSSKYSPLSSTSLYNLTTSPLRYDTRKSSQLQKRSTVYKKLYSDDDRKKV